MLQCLAVSPTFTQERAHVFSAAVYFLETIQHIYLQDSFVQDVYQTLF